MARRIFFSFHYDDIMRVNIVRNSWLCPPDRDYQRSWDQSLWESALTTSEDAVHRLIDRGLADTSVTVVLIGRETWKRKYVNYEIAQSYSLGKGLLGLYLNNMTCTAGGPQQQGRNPLDNWSQTVSGISTPLSQIYHTYDYQISDGYKNLGQWIEEAAQIAGR